jgi:hypothetical protein
VTLLADYPWRLKYTPEDGNLVKLFYVPALEDAVRYDRLHRPACAAQSE